MTPVEFPERTLVLAENQPEYTPLPVHISPDNTHAMTACFELSDDEIQTLLKTKRIWYTQLTFGNLFHPIILSVDNPFE